MEGKERRREGEKGSVEGGHWPAESPVAGGSPRGKEAVG